MAAAQPAPESIRVAVVRAEPEVTVQVHGGFTILTRLTGNPIQEGRGLRRTAVRALPDGIALGEEILPVDGVRIEAAGEASISLNGKRVRGALEIVRQQGETLLVINHIALEDYLRGVLSKEAPDYWPQAALQAIAIAARTYALWHRFTKAQALYDVTGDVLSQEYGGRSAEKAATSRAVEATEGLLLLYRGTLFPTFYHSTCGGVTEHARVMGPFDLPPLAGGVVCTFCTASPFYRWQRRLSKADVAWALRQSPYGAVGSIRDVRVIRRTPTRRAQQIRIVGARRTLTLTGYEFRALFGFDRIRSPLVSITPVGESFVFDGRGWGHGVGMCQWGAAELARRGLTASEILAFYYPHTELTRVGDLATRHVEVVGGS